MLHELPAEIALHAISFLPLCSLSAISQVSRNWNSLIAINEASVYRNAAIIHRFIHEDQFRTGSTPDDWKAYCRRWVEIERGWRGKAPSIVRELTATGTGVHRIKVDYDLGLVITTSQKGGLLVCDIKSNRTLWSLPATHVIHYAHCEYDRGYIVFNRIDNCKEVWRRTLDVDSNQQSETSPPDQAMLEESNKAASVFRSPDRLRGHFKAWALLRMPEITRAFRFAYPTLIAAASNNAYLWDVPRSQLVLVIRDLQRAHHGQELGHINYVEVDDLFVFICGLHGLRIFGREGGALLYQLSTLEICSARWDVRPQNGAASVVRPQTLLYNTSLVTGEFIGECMACHVSPSGNDLAILTTHGRLVILPDFQRLFAGSNAVHPREIAIVLNFQPFSSEEEISNYLAVGDQNDHFKLAIATSKGIYLISPDLDFDPLTADRPSAPGMTVCRLSKFDNGNFLAFLSCLQITQDAIYFTYMPSRGGDTAQRSHPHGGAAHGPLGMQSFSFEYMEDGYANPWEDESDSEDEGLVGIPIGPEDFIINDFLPTTTNTVYSVSF